MNETNYNIIQVHAVLSLLGFLLISAVSTFLFGNSTRAISVGYRAFQTALSIYVLLICHKDFAIGKGKSFYVFYILILLAYTLRMIFDMMAGPFVTILSRDVFLNDIMMVVLSCFTAAWAMIASRKYLNIEKIVKITFWIGFIIVVMSRSLVASGGMALSYADSRLNISRGLHSLALVKLGVIEVIAAMHLLFNGNRETIWKIIYIVGLLLGTWIMLASGARGGMVGLIVALGIYWILSSRKNIGLTILAVTIIILVTINIVPILIWLSNYYPVVSNRLLETILEGEESNRDILRARAFNLIVQNPLFGFSYRLNADITGYTTHNGILDIMLALGVPMGLLFVYFFYIKGIIMAVRMMTNRQQLFSTVMALTFMISSMTGASITSESFLFSMCLLSSMYYYHYS